ncbi:probable pectinesterase/pectinesterase inhibitor 33 [Lactuca sativa]|uniref:probable pectinesterase/pectinesterase inhibitor 33 n=1 Tax=Lactuca sativa TaxID=4236 RepID=UPI0022AF4550|nr:probable pectinesterase/pectinesterase inhibitor 33 [Lactuca sativa]
MVIVVVVVVVAVLTSACISLLGQVKLLAYLKKIDDLVRQESPFPLPLLTSFSSSFIASSSSLKSCYQDTLFVLAQRQFYKLCYVYGTIDFIFGNAAVVFQNCMILARKPLNGQANMITAQGRGDPFQNTGISIHNSRVMAAPDLKPLVGSVQTFLGRPWQEYSRTVYMKTFIDTHVNPQGWSPWGNTDFAFKTLYFGEYACFGPGATTQNRVEWPGYHDIKTQSEASQFTVENLISGRGWLRATGIPFIVGL